MSDALPASSETINLTYAQRSIKKDWPRELEDADEGIQVQWVRAPADDAAAPIRDDISDLVQNQSVQERKVVDSTVALAISSVEKSKVLDLRSITLETSTQPQVLTQHRLVKQIISLPLGRSKMSSQLHLMKRRTCSWRSKTWSQLRLVLCPSRKTKTEVP